MLGTLRPSLNKTLSETTPHRSDTGIAVSDWEQPDAQTAARRVEFVYRGKSAAQQHYFKLLEGQWKIERADSGEGIKLPIPYGTGVSEKE